MILKELFTKAIPEITKATAKDTQKQHKMIKQYTELFGKEIKSADIENDRFSFYEKNDQNDLK